MDKAQILKDIKKFYDFKTDTDFAHFLDITAQNLSKWYSRKSFDIHTLTTKCVELNPEWILTGEGKMLKTHISDTVNKEKSLTISEVFNVLKIQSESVKIKDEQTTQILGSLTAKDKQMGDILNILVTKDKQIGDVLNILTTKDKQIDEMLKIIKEQNNKIKLL